MLYMFLLAGTLCRDLWERCGGRQQKVRGKLQEVVSGGNDLAHRCRGGVADRTETPVRKKDN